MVIFFGFYDGFVQFQYSRFDFKLEIKIINSVARCQSSNNGNAMISFNAFSFLATMPKLIYWTRKRTEINTADANWIFGAPKISNILAEEKNIRRHKNNTPLDNCATILQRLKINSFFLCSRNQDLKLGFWTCTTSASGYKQNVAFDFLATSLANKRVYPKGIFMWGTKPLVLKNSVLE